MHNLKPLGVLAAVLAFPAATSAHGSFAAGDPGDPSTPARVIEVK